MSTAISPFAPTGRNTFFRRHHSGKLTVMQIRLRRMVYLAFLMAVIRFWNAPFLLRLRNGDSRVLRQEITTRGQDIQDLLSRLIRRFLSRLMHFAKRQREQDSEQNASNNRQAQHQDHSTVSTKAVTRTLDDDVDLANTDGSAHLSTDSTSCIRDNFRKIQSVLNYWFGQYTPEMAQKKLWMIAHVEQRRIVDRDITEQFEELVCELAAESNKMWHDWCHDTELYGHQGKLAAMVALDQFSRHIRRFHDETRIGTTSSFPPQDVLDSLAFKTAELFMEHHKVEIDCGMIPVPMFVFALMPYRHASTISSVQFVQECIERTARREEQTDALNRRFRKATNRRMAVLQDEARRTGGVESSKEDKTFSDEDILETFPFVADMSKARKHVVCKIIETFLNDRGITASRTGGSPFPVVVSLSGGVDSMVIASVLAHLSNSCDYSLHIVAVHIDYANRPESTAEADYVRRYCERLGVWYKCRRIDEVTRGVTARDDYERIAREVRYNIYRETVQECQQTGANLTEVGVMLGHHRGDLRENVLSNSHKGCGPLDLSGMTPVSRNDGVILYRPLLPLEKKEIFDYAHTFGVPYFKDTTPHWSTRGKLRSKLLPLLEEIYGEGSMNNLSTLATESDSARELLMQKVLSPFLDQVERRPMGIMFATARWKDQGLFFWKFVLREALHRAGLGMFSDKSVVEFLKRVKVDPVKAGWLQCRRDYAVYLNDDGKVFVLFPDSFPFRESDELDCWGKPVAFGVHHSVSIGPWKVHAELVGATEVAHEAEALLERKAVSSMEDFMKGYIRYYVRVPSKDADALRPLVFVREFNRQTRPSAWKSVDLKIQSVLPILGAAEAEASVDGVGGDTDWKLAKVVLEREGADHSS